MISRLVTRRALAGGVLAGAGVFAPRARAADGVMARVAGSKVMRYGVVNGQPPYCYKDPASGAWRGFLIDMNNALAKSIGVTAQPVESTWGNSVLDIEANKVDIFFGLAPSAERAKVVDFTGPLYQNAFALVARKGFAPKTWDDMNKPSVRIAIETGTVYDQNVGKLCPNATITRLKSNNDALLAVQAGRADCQIVVVIFALTDLTHDPDLGHLVVPEPLFGSTTNGMVAKEADPQWRTTVDAWVAAKRKSGEIRRMLVASLEAVGVKASDVPSQVLF